MMPNAIFQSVNEGYCIGSEPSELITYVDALVPYGEPVPGLSGWEVCGCQEYFSGDEHFTWHLMRPVGTRDFIEDSDHFSDPSSEFWFYSTPEGQLLHYGWEFGEREFEPGDVVEHVDLEGGLHRFRIQGCQTFAGAVTMHEFWPVERVHRVIVEAIAHA